MARAGLRLLPRSVHVELTQACVSSSETVIGHPRFLRYSHIAQIRHGSGAIFFASRSEPANGAMLRLRSLIQLFRMYKSSFEITKFNIVNLAVTVAMIVHQLT